jgi:hypothetical protein
VDLLQTKLLYTAWQHATQTPRKRAFKCTMQLNLEMRVERTPFLTALSTWLSIISNVSFGKVSFTSCVIRVPTVHQDPPSKVVPLHSPCVAVPSTGTHLHGKSENVDQSTSSEESDDWPDATANKETTITAMYRGEVDMAGTWLKV